MHFLTIAIPTYNRAAKTERLLHAVIGQILDGGLQDEVNVLVSDNASPDDTRARVAAFMYRGVDVQYIRQEANLGFDGNLLGLYSVATTPFLWWIGDDDLPTKGMIARILSIVKTEDPDAMMGSFLQPRTGKVYNFPEPVHIEHDPALAVEYVCRQQKISGCIHRRLDLTESERAFLVGELGHGWMHLALAFTALDRASSPCLALVSDFIAECDEDYDRLEWTPHWYLDLHKTMKHPFVARNCPGLAERSRDSGYRTAIGLSFAAKSGTFRVQSQQDYDRFVASLEWRPRVLLGRPGVLLRFLALKTRTARFLWPLTLHLLPWLRRLRAGAGVAPRE